MNLEKIQLSNFKNYENHFFEFSAGLNCIVGRNGSGKTNLIDAVYFLALTKSFLHAQDAHCIKFEQDYMTLAGVFVSDQPQLITCQIHRGGKKVFFQDKSPYERITHHIGKFPVVLIAPDDTDLIRDASDTRRKLFDGIIAQTNSGYLKAYQAYNRALDQRNSLLKQFAENQYLDIELLKIYSHQVLEFGKTIFWARHQFIDTFLPIFKKHYLSLSEGFEEVDIRYHSEWLLPNFEEVFENATAGDLAAQRTTKGVHKDDFIFTMNHEPIKKFGSQGQRKSFIMAIRLAQFEIIETLCGMKPILLLDDIFDKLDEKRIAKLIDMIKKGVFGQIFLSDARPNRVKDLLLGHEIAVRFIETEQLKGIGF
jgi:DNA replication and repair protein RecF